MSWMHQNSGFYQPSVGQQWRPLNELGTRLTVILLESRFKNFQRCMEELLRVPIFECIVYGSPGLEETETGTQK